MWIASHFDRVSTLFVLCGLVLFIRLLGKIKHPAIYRILSLACMVLAILSKESAYTFPLLLLLYMVLSRGRSVRAPGKFRILIPFFAVAAVLFAYRWILFGGIGGYADPQTGRPMAAMVRFIPAVKVLLFRLWAVLFFPVNWKIQPGLILSVFWAACIPALLWISTARISRKRLIFPLGFVLITALPPLHLLLIGSDLQGARLLYLPSVGFCLLLATAAEKMSSRMRLILPVILIAFQLGSARAQSGKVGVRLKKSQAVCTAAVRCCGSIAAPRLLDCRGSLDGVYFFANGFPECMEIQEKSIPAPACTGRCNFRLLWDESTRELRCMNP